MYYFGPVAAYDLPLHAVVVMVERPLVFANPKQPISRVVVGIKRVRLWYIKLLINAT